MKRLTGGDALGKGLVRQCVCVEPRCKHRGVKTDKTLQDTCHWARLLGGAFCCWCGGDLRRATEREEQ